MNRTLKADALKSTSLTLGPLEAAAVEAVSFVTKNISKWYVKCKLHCLQDTLEEEAAALASAAATPVVEAFVDFLKTKDKTYSADNIRSKLTLRLDIRIVRT